MIINFKNDPFRPGGQFHWPTGFDDSTDCLYRIPYATCKKDLFDEGGLSRELEQVVSSWSFEIIIKSALYYSFKYLENSRKKASRSTFSWVDWYILTLLVLSKNTSKTVFDLILALYPAPDKETLFGVKRGLSSISLSFLPVSGESLNNLLLLLKIDIVSREALIKKIVKSQKLDELVDFLIMFECTINKNLVLTSSLMYYFSILNNDTFTTKKIEEEINSVFEFMRISLETFSVLDLFDYGEYNISGSSKISSFSFNAGLLSDLITNPTNIPIEIFKLFEYFVYSTRKQTIFLIKISFERGGDFYKLIYDFCFACQKEIRFYAKTEVGQTNIALLAFVFKIIAPAMGLLIYFASNPSAVTRWNKRGDFSPNYKSIANTALMADTAFVEEELFENQRYEDGEVNFEKAGIQGVDESKETVLNPAIQEQGLKKEKKFVRTRTSSFATMIPHFAKKPVGPVVYLPLNKPSAL